MRTYVIAWGVMLAVVSAPVLLSGHFTNSDGAAHLYSSWVLLRLVGGDPTFAPFAINPTPVPNATGHLILSLLQLALNSAAAQKAMLIAVLGSFTASVMWFQFKLTERRAPVLMALYSLAIAINSFWLVGTYNFLIGVSLGLIGLGCFYRWRDDLDLAKSAAIVVLVAAAYFSHLLCAAMLVGSLFLLAFTARDKAKAFAVLAGACVVLAPLFWAYQQLVSAQGTQVSPGWTVDAAFRLRQLLPPDIFSIINRRNIPFVEAGTFWFAIFSPIIYIAAAILLMFRPRWRALAAPARVVLFLTILAGVLSVAAPDNFGAGNGTLIRERMLLFACVLAPVFFLPTQREWPRRIATAALGFVVVFQTAVLAEYGQYSTRAAEEFIAATANAAQGSGLAAVVILDERRRFYVEPHTQDISYAAAGRELIAWDNYEWGYYMFPAKTASQQDRAFAAELTRSSLLYPWAPPEVLEQKRNGLAHTLSDPRIDLLCVYGSDPAVDAIIAAQFDPSPVYQGAELSAYRRRER